MQTHARTLKIHRSKKLLVWTRCEWKIGTRAQWETRLVPLVLNFISHVVSFCVLLTHNTQSAKHCPFLIFDMSESAYTQNKLPPPPGFIDPSALLPLLPLVPYFSFATSLWRLHRRERRTSVIYRSHVHLRRAKVNDVLDQLFGCSENMEKKEEEKNETKREIYGFAPLVCRFRHRRIHLRSFVVQ